MRAIIIAIITIYSIMNCSEARPMIGKQYLRSVNKAVITSCNKIALLQINNTELNNCVNNVYDLEKCKHIPNFTDFNRVKNECITNFNSEVGCGIMIAIFSWVFILLCIQ